MFDEVGAAVRADVVAVTLSGTTPTAAVVRIAIEIRLIMCLLLMVYARTVVTTRALCLAAVAQPNSDVIRTPTCGSHNESNASPTCRRSKSTSFAGRA
jgi:hypothetical protein